MAQKLQEFAVDEHIKVLYVLPHSGIAVGLASAEQYSCYSGPKLYADRLRRPLLPERASVLSCDATHGANLAADKIKLQDYGRCPPSVIRPVRESLHEQLLQSVW